MSETVSSQKDKSGTGIGYMPQLDGLRTVAISGVLFGHFVGQTNFRIAHWERLGVVLFFVLSGFLITGILLRCRDAGPANGLSGWRAVRTFYARRVLRIFPIYYLTLFICTILNYRPISDNLFWHITYLSNVYSALFGKHYAAAAHLWSLCVEEQFYLVWPFVVIFAPNRLLRKIIIGLIIASVSYKTIGSLSSLSWEATTRPLLGCLDSLGLGALLALHLNDPVEHPKSDFLFFRIAPLIGWPSLLALQSLWLISPVNPRSMTAYVGLTDFAAALTFLTLIRKAARNSSWAFGGFLAWSPIRYVGKISYGIYLYHLLLVPLLRGIFRVAGIEPISPGIIRFFVYTSVTLMLAALSWHFIEKPINGMKKYFSYFET